MDIPQAALLMVALLSAVAALGLGLLALDRQRRLADARADGSTSGRRGNGNGNTSAEPTAEELADLVELVGMGLVNIGADGRISSANGPAHRLLGRAPGSLVDDSAIAAFLDHRVEALVARAIERGSGQLDLVLPGEPQRTLLLRAERDARGGVWLLVSDVSELRRLRRIRTEFIDNLSHELRTPLTTIRVLSEVLSAEADRTQLPDRVSDSIAKIDVETGHLAQMVTELLDLARIEQGETALRREPVDLGQVVEDSIARLRPYAERQGVQLHTEALGDPAGRTVEGDAERLGQLLINLVQNAVKFSQPGAPVTVRVVPAQASVRVEVQDQGPGIPRRDLERVFERFYKVDRARTRGGPGGTGLGLAIARHIVEAHGGRIWVQSEEGAGAKFIFELPRGPV